MATGLDLLVGSWRVISVRYLFSDTGESVEPFGPSQEGRMVLEPDGRNPAYGGEQLRLFTIVDDGLTIRTLAMTVPMFPGRMHVAELVFNREHRSVRCAG